MQSEIEAKFINIDESDIRSQLKSVGGVCEQPMRLMRRVVFHNDFMHAKDGFVRVRDEGYRTTITYKQYDDADSINGVREIETTVGDFETTVDILKAIGISHFVYRETRRETWKVGEVEVVIDEWPWLNPYIEIEGPSEQAVQRVATKLGFDWNDAVFGGPASVYLRHYPALGEKAADIIGRDLEVMRFEDPVPESFHTDEDITEKKERRD